MSGAGKRLGGRLLRAAVALLALAFAPGARAAPPQTVAVLYFDYDGADEQLFVLRKGLAQMIGADLLAVEKITVVERERLEEVLAELELQHSKRVDPASAVRIGKLLGARYLVFGSYFQLRGALQATARVVETETGKVLYAQNALGPPDDFLTVELKLSAGLSGFFANRLPAPATTKAEPASTGAAGGGPKGTTPKTFKKPPKKLATKTALAYSQALDAADRKDKTTAVAKLKDVLAQEADFALAADQLAALN